MNQLIHSCKIIIFLAFLALASSAFLSHPIQQNNAKIKTINNILCSKVSVWVEAAEDGFVDKDENLMVGEVCLKALKAYASNPYGGEKRFLGAAALVSRPESNVCDCWIADSLLDETNVQLEGAIQLLDDLFYYHLSRSNAKTMEEMVCSFIVQSGTANSDYHCASYRAALYRGFKPLKELTNNDPHMFSNSEHLDLNEEDLDSLVFDVSTGLDCYSSNQSTNAAKSIHDILQKTNPKNTLELQFE